MGKGKGISGKILLITTVVGIGLLGFGMLQLNVDLSFIGFSLTGVNATALTVPELDESNTRLLGTNSFIPLIQNGSTISTVETSPSFAVAERFQVSSPTVITDFVMKMSAQDQDVTVTGFVWSLSGSTPIRLAQSAETYNGTQILSFEDKSFTFPQAKILEPTQIVDCPEGALCQPPEILTYAVGIRVDQNLVGSFTYQFLPDIEARSHSGVIDRAVTVDGETGFTDHNSNTVFGIGVIGIDIFHNANFAEDLMEELIEDLMDNSTATEEEMLEACIAIFPPPEGCVNEDNLAPQECGVTEELINNACVCIDGFERQEVIEGQFTLEGVEPTCIPILVIDSSIEIPPRLQVSPRVDPIVFLGLGGVILVGSLIGIGVRTFRK